ncbi:hypothetical protein KP509_12G025300 [Ceratopteris richardii]|uniref:Uncharacterized protein n=1 Tax=Ceratopteris richardii TaxID=49495 RepID=A0A8T2TK11_CERRI|nr:hypothetical protein KP509_12G025300 [Ceratopteris richardii]
MMGKVTASSLADAGSMGMRSSMEAAEGETWPFCWHLCPSIGYSEGKGSCSESDDVFCLQFW